MTQKEKVATIKNRANKAKQDLMSLESELEDIGAEREREQLAKIILRLEVWQNRK